jgi:hypothetical protein
VDRRVTRLAVHLLSRARATSRVRPAAGLARRTR